MNSKISAKLEFVVFVSSATLLIAYAAQKLIALAGIDISFWLSSCLAFILGLLVNLSGES